MKTKREGFGKESAGVIGNSRDKLIAAKKKYRATVEKLYPSWQDQLERDGIRRLEAIRRRKETVNERREFARVAFEKERSLRSMMVEQENDLEELERAERAEMIARAKERTRLEQAARLVVTANEQQQQPQYRQLSVVTDGRKNGRTRFKTAKNTTPWVAACAPRVS